MANIKKSFNFRNGVQVDSDNLLVTSTGLVGIGTTVPSESLDVIGNVTISGSTNTTVATIGVLTVTSVKPTEIIGAGVSIKSGIITSSGAGVVTFFGDGGNLTNLPTSQFSTVGGGSTNVFVIPNVGIATTNPSFNLQIGNDVDSGGEGVGINSLGDIKASGIITATGFVGNVSGNLTGNVTGNVTGNLTGDINSGVSTVTVLKAIQLNVSGLGTVIGNFVTNGDLTIQNATPELFFEDTTNEPDYKIRTQSGHFNIMDDTQTDDTEWRLSIRDGGTVDIPGNLVVDGQTNLNNVSVAGISTFTGTIDANSNIDLAGDLDVDGHTNLDNVNIAGVTTTAGIIEGISGENKIPALY